MTQSKLWHSAALRLQSSILTADEISNVMQLSPTDSFEKGTPYSQRNPMSKIREQTLWIWESGCSQAESIELHLERVASLIESKHTELQKLLRTCLIDIFCGYSSEVGQGGFALNSSLLKRIASLDIDIIFDIYS